MNIEDYRTYCLSISCSSQKADKKYDVSINNSTFKNSYPKVLFDDAHNNSHKSNRTYSPFVHLIENDGCIVKSNKNALEISYLHNYDILVIVNAKGQKEKYYSAFSKKECNDIEKWVFEGGSLITYSRPLPIWISSRRIIAEIWCTYV